MYILCILMFILALKFITTSRFTRDLQSQEDTLDIGIILIVISYFLLFITYL